MPRLSRLQRKGKEVSVNNNIKNLLEKLQQRLMTIENIIAHLDGLYTIFYEQRKRSKEQVMLDSLGTAKNCFLEQILYSQLLVLQVHTRRILHIAKINLPVMKSSVEEYLLQASEYIAQFENNYSNIKI